MTCHYRLPTATIHLVIKGRLSREIMSFAGENTSLGHPRVWKHTPRHSYYRLSNKGTSMEVNDTQTGRNLIKTGCPSYKYIQIIGRARMFPFIKSQGLVAISSRWKFLVCKREVICWFVRTIGTGYTVTNALPQIYSLPPRLELWQGNKGFPLQNIWLHVRSVKMFTCSVTA